MYTAKIENVAGQTLLMTGSEAVYQIVSIAGLNPPRAQINQTTIVGLDGALFNSSKLETRNIVIDVKINGDIESNRQRLYRLFRTKEWCRFYYTNDSVSVYIDAYVESVECDLFQLGERAQISLICPNPYFKAIEQIAQDISTKVSAFVFPFSINEGEPIPFSTYESDLVSNLINDSATPSGVTIELDIEAAVSDIVIRNTGTGEEIHLNYPFAAGDRVEISTEPGSKSVKLTRDGTTESIFSAVQRGTVFFQLQPGDNTFGYLVDGGENNSSVFVLFRYRTQYRGV